MLSLTNLDRLPQAVRNAVRIFSQDMLAIHGAGVETIAVYGSSLDNNFIPKVSNINLCFVFKHLGFDVLRHSLSAIAKARKNKITAPLFLTKEYLSSSHEVFPIEFLEIKDRHLVIYGDDVFRDLVVEKKYIRLFCAQQIKGKLLRIRQSYLEIGHNPKMIKRLLNDSLNSLMPVFRQLIRLAGGAPAVHKKEILDQIAVLFAVDVSVLVAIHHDKSGIAPIGLSAAESHLKDYLQQIEQLARAIDRL